VNGVDAYKAIAGAGHRLISFLKMETTRCISSLRMPDANPFDRCSEQYSRFRPDYPDGLVEYILSLCDSTADTLLLDVGAGTGKASAPFAARGTYVVSVEPSLSMIAEGLRSDPNLRYVCGSAEQLPIASNRASAVICGQAFHWFDAPRALTEFARTLKLLGYVCLFWNTRDLRDPAAALFDGLIHKWNPGHDPGYRDRDWSEVIRPAEALQFIEWRQFQFVMPMTIDDWIGLSRSISYVQSMAADKLPGFEKELRAGLSRFDKIDCPYITELWIAQKTGVPLAP
jgi:SAM-dependent methyltransferase